MFEQYVASSAKRKNSAKLIHESGSSFIIITNNKGPMTLSCGIPLITECQAENSLLIFLLSDSYAVRNL